MKKVIVFRYDLLPISETFIKEQILAMTHWQPTLAGYRVVQGGLKLDGLNICRLPGFNNKWQRFHIRFCCWSGWAHGPTVRALRAINANLIHIHFGTDAVDIWPSARKLGLPILITLHGYDINIYREWWEAGHGGRHRKQYPSQLLELAREPLIHFIAVSEAIRERAIEYGIPKEKICVHHIGVNTKLFQRSSRPIDQRQKRILFIGRLVEKKGVPYLIKAFADLLQRHPDAQLTIIGDGPMRKELETLSGYLGASVSFRGALDSTEIKKEMSLARVLCLPSIRAENGDAEGFGMVILEAQAAGIPVITSARGGATEGIEDNNTGFRFKERDTTALSQYLDRLLSDASQLSLMSNAAIKFINSQFDLHNLTKELEDYYGTMS